MSSEVINLFKDSKKEVPDIRYVLPGSKEEIFMKPFTTRDQKAILKAIEKEDHILIQEAFDSLLRCSVTSPNFDPDKLYSKDRECLLIELSKNSVTDEIDHNWTCPECEETNELKFTADDLEYTDAVEDSIREDIIQFDGYDFVIKVSNPTREDEKKIIALGKKEGGKKGISQTEVLNATFACVIKEYKEVVKKIIKTEEGGEEEVEREVFKKIKFEDRVRIYEGLDIQDKKKIEKFFEGIKDYGFDLKLGDKTCSKCAATTEVSVDWIDFFLI